MVIKNDQFVAFQNKKLNDFRKLQVSNVVDKFDHRLSGNNLESAVTALIDLAFGYGLITDVEVESFILICFDNGISFDYFKNNTSIDEIFAFPDRANDDKLYHFFQYLKSSRK